MAAVEKQTAKRGTLQYREVTAAKWGKSVSTIKRYEKAGILTPIRFVEGGRVSHSIEEVARREREMAGE